MTTRLRTYAADRNRGCPGSEKTKQRRISDRNEHQRLQASPRAPPSVAATAGGIPRLSRARHLFACPSSVAVLFFVADGTNTEDDSTWTQTSHTNLLSHTYIGFFLLTFCLGVVAQTWEEDENWKLCTFTGPRLKQKTLRITNHLDRSSSGGSCIGAAAPPGFLDLDMWQLRLKCFDLH